MTDPNLVILYVTDVTASLAFWSDLLGRTAVEQAETFAMLPLGNGIMLGLWKVDDVEPGSRVTGGGTEIALTAASRDDLDQMHTDWLVRRRIILQPPTDMDFGRTFTAADPDGHRLRVFCPAG